MESTFLPQANARNDGVNLAQSTQERENSRAQLLTSLKYDGMDQRIRSIPRAIKNTFDWILDPSHDMLEHNFAAWLVDDRPLYWIQGLAGSGKSTLMKRIWNDKQTQSMLARDNTSLPSVILKHSFWLPSKNSLRKNLKGVMYAMVYGLLSVSTSATDNLLRESSRFGSLKSYSDWSERDLETTLYSLLANRDLFDYTCIFVDALDEIESSSERDKTLNFIRELSDFEKFHTKICVSSRPESQWIEAFQDKPQLRLQDLTKADIRIYVTDMLSDELLSTQPDHSHSSSTYNMFLDELVEKSQGVFLWASLAANTLLGKTTNASWTTLRDLLRQLPSEVENLYEWILANHTSDGNSVKAEVAAYLSLCLKPSYGLPWYITLFEGEGFFLHQALLLWKVHFQKETGWQRWSDRETLHNDYLRLERRILDICACFLTPTYGNSLNDYPSLMYTTYRWPKTKPENPSSGPSMVKFSFAHRSAADFFSDIPAGRQIIQHCPLTPTDFFMAHVDAEILLYGLWHEFSPAYRAQGIDALAKTFYRIQQLATEDQISDLHVSQAIRKIKSALAELASASVAGSESQASDVASGYVFNLAKNQTVMDSNSLWIGFDVEGLLLEASIDVWYNSYREDFDKPDASGCQTFTTAYKNYLLICATKGNLPRVARHLIENGADLYAEHYLPINRPEKRSAAGQLLVVSGNPSYANLTPASVTAWADVLSSCTQKTQHLLFQPFWGIQAGVNSQHFLCFFYSTQHSPSETFVLDVSAHLSLWLQHATRANCALPTVEPEDCVGFWMTTDSNEFGVSIQPLFARSWHGYAHRGFASNARMFPGALPFRCCRCLADQNDGFWKVVSLSSGNVELHHKYCHLDDHGPKQVGGINYPRPAISRVSRERFETLLKSADIVIPKQLERSDSQRKRQAETYKRYLFERGFFRNPSDPEVPQEPLRVFRQVDDNLTDTSHISTRSQQTSSQ